VNKRIETIPSEHMQALIRYHWPGNVRELQNVIERAVILASGPVLRVVLPKSKQLVLSGKGTLSKQETLEQAVRKHILAALEDTDWGGPLG
jgi:formate hydrogenlyase transcriptional activator